jgi:hypothetical protein
MKKLVAVVLTIILLATAPTPSISWQSLGAGLEIASVSIGQPSPVGDRKITVLRIDPVNWEFSILAASAKDKKARTAKQWATEFGQTAIVNAGMFQADGLKNVGFMKIGDHMNNPKFNDDNTIVVAEPTDSKLPHFQIIDRECQNWQQMVSQYRFATQGIRMIDCKGNNRWSQQPRLWSMVVMGMDKSGKALFIFCRSPYSVHDFIEILMALDLNIKNAMYLEGGPEASFYLKTTEKEIEQFGSYETGFFESDANNRAWPIPNVIGIRPRKATN